VLAAGLVVFHRSHADLGTNWSITLEIREGHRLVTEGVYRRVRHPMYLALLLHGLGQAILLPNWVAGPAYLVVMLVLVAFRLGPEERMMRERFGAEYDAYAARTRAFGP
jgi:protein-S-isoprenylcysteine O-methyltransferase Ste14